MATNADKAPSWIIYRRSGNFYIRNNLCFKYLCWKYFVTRRFCNVVHIFFTRSIFFNLHTDKNILMAKIFRSTTPILYRVSEATRSNLSTLKFEIFPERALLPTSSVDLGRHWCHSCDKMDQAFFPLCSCTLQAMNWTVGRHGNKANPNLLCLCPVGLLTVNEYFKLPMNISDCNEYSTSWHHTNPQVLGTSLGI